MNTPLPRGNYLIDLHLHIDGSMSPETAILLAEMQGVTLPTTDKQALSALLKVPRNCTDLNEYLKRFALPCSLMMTRETISEMILRLKEELKQQGLIYAELRFAPQLHTANGLTQEEVVQAAIEGSNRSDLPTALILCCMRGDANEAENRETVRLAHRYRDCGVAAVDLAGAEGLYKTAHFRSLFAYARELGLRYTIHAGEADDYTSVRDAIDFGASRIGHGIHAAADEGTMALLCERDIPLEVCLSSNLQTKAAESIERHPLPILLEHGVAVTLNTDNPVVSDTTLRAELELAKEHFGLSDTDIRDLLIHAARYSFAERSLQSTLVAEIVKAFDTKKQA